MSTGIPFWDMMLSLGKASQQALSGYSQQAMSGLEAASEQAVRSVSEQAARSVGGAHRVASNVEVIPVGEETLNVTARQVAGETTRVRRVVVETPVERSVALREERVIVERRKPTAATATTTQGILTDTSLEMSDTFEVVEAWKSARVVEEVVLRREVTERTETVRDTVRHDEVVVEQARHTQPRPAPVVQQNRTVTATASQPGAKSPAPAADLKVAADRLDAAAGQQEKALATLHETLRPEPGAKADDVHPAPQPQPEPPKAVTGQPTSPARPDANAFNDKGNRSPKS